jgi:predicted permease
MKRLRRFLRRLRAVLSGRRADSEIAEEFESHIRMQTEDNVLAGMTPEEAHRAAVLKFGALEAVKETYREQSRLALLDTLRTDCRFAWRMLIKNRTFSALAILMLAVGIGVNVAVFSVTNGVLFKGFRFVERNDRILYLGTRKDGRWCCVSYPDFQDWRAQSRSFEGMGAVADLRITLSDNAGMLQIYSATRISANGFQVLGQQPILGRDFVPADELPGAEPVAVLTYRFWEQRFGKDPAVIGRVLRINDSPTTIIGVMRDGFSFPQNQDLWVPLVPDAVTSLRDVRGLWFAFGRLAKGVTRESARAELEGIGAQLARAYPQTNAGWVPGPRSFSEFFIGPNATATYGALWGAVALVLLIASANLANLMLSRAIGRSREISVRVALGAARWRIARQLLIESVMLSVVGGICGWWLGKAGVSIYHLMSNPPTHAWSDNLFDFSADYRVVAYFIVISIGTGLLFGLAPALRLSRLDVNTALKIGGPAGNRSRHLSALLLTAELALAVVLLAGAGLLLQSFLKVYAADIGISAANVLSMSLNLPEARYPTAKSAILFFDNLGDRLEDMPGVESVSIADAFPTAGSRHMGYQIEAVEAADKEILPTVSTVTVGPQYFKTMGATLLFGRDFNQFDEASSVPAVIVNERFAAKFWPGEDPLGKRVRLFNEKTPAWRLVVGVVSNIVQNDLNRQELAPLVYVPYRQRPSPDMNVFIRTRVPPETLAQSVRREVQALDPSLPLWLGPFTLEDRLAGLGYYWSHAIDAVLLLILAAIGLLLASIGVYAVTSHSVSRRRQEIGVRIAIGASARDILRLVFKEGVLPLIAGLTIGLGMSFVLNKLLTAELVQISPHE